MMGYVNDWSEATAYFDIAGDGIFEFLTLASHMGYPEEIEIDLKKLKGYKESKSSWHFNEYKIFRWSGSKFDLIGKYYEYPEFQ